jgi:hypothetical protein
MISFGAALTDQFNFFSRQAISVSARKSLQRLQQAARSSQKFGSMHAEAEEASPNI